MHIRIILEIFEEYKCPNIAFSLQSSRCVSNEQPCLETTGLYDALLLLSSFFHFFYFIFSPPISFMFSNFSFLLLFFFNTLSSRVENLLVYIYVNNMYNTCISENLWIFAWWLRWWRICLQCRTGFNPWVRKIPWRRKWQPIPIFLPGEFHGQRSLAGYTAHGFTKTETWLSD